MKLKPQETCLPQAVAVPETWLEWVQGVMRVEDTGFGELGFGCLAPWGAERGAGWETGQQIKANPLPVVSAGTLGAEFEEAAGI